MSEAIRTCHKCGRQYTGYHCQSAQCKAARKAHAASSRKSRAARSGNGRKMRRYAAGGFPWASASSIGPVHADACPKSGGYDDGKSSVNEDADNADWMNHPD